MFKQKEEVVIVAVLAIIVSALLSGYGVYYFLRLRPSKAIEPQLLQNSPRLEDQADLSKNLEMTNTDGESDSQKAAQSVGDFYNYLESGDYDLAVPLFNWQYRGIEDEIKEITGPDFDFGNKAEILQKICSQENVMIRINILRVKATPNGRNYDVIINYLEEDDQIYVSSSRVAGQFINETDFVVPVEKINDTFLINSLPGVFVVTGE